MPCSPRSGCRRRSTAASLSQLTLRNKLNRTLGLGRSQRQWGRSGGYRRGHRGLRRRQTSQSHNPSAAGRAGRAPRPRGQRPPRGPWLTWPSRNPRTPGLKAPPRTCPSPEMHVPQIVTRSQESTGFVWDKHRPHSTPGHYQMGSSVWVMWLQGVFSPKPCPRL